MFGKELFDDQNDISQVCVFKLEFLDLVDRRNRKRCAGHDLLSYGSTIERI